MSVPRLAPVTGGLDTPDWNAVVNNFPYKAFDFLVYKDGSDFTALNGQTGVVDYDDTDEATLINEVIAALANGGSFRTMGKNETWTLDSVIDIDNNNIYWFSDWSLTFKAKADLNNYMVKITGDKCRTDGLHLDGNRANQSADPPTNVDGLWFYQANHSKCLNCFCEDVREYAIRQTDCDFHECAGNHCIDSGWNGISIGTLCTQFTVHHNFVEGYSDVGITSYGTYGSVDHNTVLNGDLTIGSIDSQWGLGVEGGSHVVFDANVVANCKTGIQVQPTFDHITICNNTFYDWDRLDAGKHAIEVMGSYCKIHDNTCDGTAGGSDYGIKIDTGDYCKVDNNTVLTCVRGIEIDDDADHTDVTNNQLIACGTGLLIIGADVDRTFVNGNNFDTCTDDVDDTGTDTIYGDNVDKDGNWDEGVEP